MLLGFIKSEKIRNELYRYIKLDTDLRKTISMRRTAFAFRFFGGAGYGLPFKDRDPSDSNNFYIPFFKAYYAGGANSMRAWQLRKLGPGSSKRPFEKDQAPERFGDMQLEFNAEYRFFVANIGGVLLNSALFTDMGNIWYIRKNEPDFKDGNFELRH